MNLETVQNSEEILKLYSSMELNTIYARAKSTLKIEVVDRSRVFHFKSFCFWLPGFDEKGGKIATEDIVEFSFQALDVTKFSAYADSRCTKCWGKGWVKWNKMSVPRHEVITVDHDDPAPCGCLYKNLKKKKYALNTVIPFHVEDILVSITASLIPKDSERYTELAEVLKQQAEAGRKAVEEAKANVAVKNAPEAP